MPQLTLRGPQLPFVLGGTGTFAVDVGHSAVDDRLPAGAGAIFDVSTSASAAKPVSLGAAGAWTLSIKADGSAKLVPVWRTSAALIKQYGLASYFAANTDDVVLAFTVGASAEGKFSGQMRYAALSATASLEAAGDVSFAFCTPFPGDTPLKALVEGCFGRVRLPAAVQAAPKPGEVVKFEYGGYLNLGVTVSAGYEMTGTPSIDIGQLVLSEKYALSVLGKVALGAQIGGFFGVEVRAATDTAGKVMPAWARVIVRKTRVSEFTFAADVSVGVTSELKGLPDSPHEFLGALLGVNVKNWLNLVERVRTLTDFDQLIAELDHMAVEFLMDWLQKEIGPDTLPELLAKVEKVVTQYENIEDTLITALDRYFDRITDPALGSDIGRALAKLSKLPSWDDLKGDVDPIVWKLVTELTDGDPLGWILNKAVSALQKRASGLIELGQNAAHAELRALIHFAKSQYGVQPLFDELAKLDTVPKLKAEAETRLGGLVQRLLGDDIVKLQNSQLGAVVTRLHAVLDRLDGFEKDVYAKITEATKQTATLNAHVEYRRAADDEALIDIAINTATDEGRALLHAATLGDFQQALSSFKPDVVKLNQGRLTHNLVKSSAVSVNVIGWHAGWHFQGMEKLILHTDQQIVTDDSGALTVYTTIDLTKERSRQRNQEKAFTSFLLRFLGESRGVITPDPSQDEASRQYLIDTITQMSAQYALGFADDRTSLDELSYYLSFARDFGIVDASIQPSALAALMPLQGADNFGRTSVTYDVRYQDAGLTRLFNHRLDEAFIRRVMRQVILGAYLKAGGELESLGWVYWTPGVFAKWQADRQSIISLGSLEFKPIAPSPFTGLPAPRSATLQPARQRVLDVLYSIENGLVAGLLRLEGLIADAKGGQKISPHAFENALGAFGRSLQLIDDFGESVNTTFAVFDALLTGVDGAKRASMLTLKSQAAARPVTKVLVAV
jgi:hypothetical protein